MKHAFIGYSNILCTNLEKDHKEQIQKCFFVVFLFAPPSHIHSTPYKEWKTTAWFVTLCITLTKGLQALNHLIYNHVILKWIFLLKLYRFPRLWNGNNRVKQQEKHAVCMYTCLNVICHSNHHCIILHTRLLRETIKTYKDLKSFLILILLAIVILR